MITAIDKNNSLFKPTIYVTLLIILNVIFSFLSQIIIAYYFGTTAARDAFFAAIIIPTYITSVFSGSFVVVFLPQLVNLIKKDSYEAAIFTGSVILLSAILMSTISICGLFMSDKIISLASYGFLDDQKNLSSSLLKILMPTVLFQSLTSIFTAVYQSYNKFIVASSVIIITPLSVILFMLLFAESNGIEALAFGSLFGSLVPTIILFIKLIQSKKIVFSLKNINHENIQMMLVSSLPLFASGIIYRLTGVIERMFASNLNTGSISILGYANQLSTTLVLIITGGIATTIYPHMAQSWSVNDGRQFYRYITNGVTFVILLCAPIISIMFAIGEPIIQIIFERGAFDQKSTKAVAFTFQLLMGSFLFSSLGGIISKAFYVMSKTKTIAIIAIVEVLIYLLTGFLLYGEYSYHGLAIALSVSTGFNIFLCLAYLLSINNQIQIRVILINIFKIVFAASVSFIICKIIFLVSINSMPLVLSTFVASLIGLTSYFYLSLFVLSIDGIHLIRDKIF